MSINAAARVVLLLFGCASIIWGLKTFPIFQRNAIAEDLAARIVQGHPFRLQQLQDQVAALDAIEDAAYCQPRALRSDAIVRLRIAEQAFSDADIGHLDADLAAARSAIGKALSCEPTDAYLWLSLYWVKALSEGAKPGDLDLLRMSYREGPNEGWVMAKRNHLALAAFPLLPPDLADLALAEFAKLLEPEFVNQAVDNFTGPGWPIRDRLIEQIKDRPEAQKRSFARLLEEKGVNVTVPGIVLSKPPGH